jgi:hypothetical protein
MLQPSEEMIKEIAEQLDSGMKCFYRLSTGELVIYPDELRMGGDIDEEVWGEEVEEKYYESIPFNAMENHESYQIMENFINQIAASRIRTKLEEIIQRRKAFQQFKYLLLNYPDLGQKWFTYKDFRYREPCGSR